MSLKRPLGPPSGNTPDKPPQKSRRSQRRETTSRKSFFSTKMSRRKRYLQSCLKTLVLNRVFSNPSAPYVSQLLFTRMFLECLWHSNKLIERGKQNFGTQNTFKFNWISIAGHLSFSIHSLGWQRISWADSIYCFVSWPWWSICLAHPQELGFLGQL